MGRAEAGPMGAQERGLASEPDLLGPGSTGIITNACLQGEGLPGSAAPLQAPRGSRTHFPEDSRDVSGHLETTIR